MDSQTLLLYLISTQICDPSVRETITAENLQEVCRLAEQYDLAHILARALIGLNLPMDAELSKQLKNKSRLAVYRYLRLDATCQQACQLFSREGIDFLPLKGSVLRQYYPEPWLRTSCDIDILVRPEKLETAALLLEEQLGFTRGEKGDYEISMYSPEGVLLELHFDTIGENSKVKNCREVLGKIWEEAELVEGTNQYAMSDAMFYFYHIAHIAKHFEVGGCGIRPFLDLWILNNKVSNDSQARRQLLIQGDLVKFAQAAEKLSRVWFENEPHDDLSLRMEQFILKGEMYWGRANLAAVGQVKAGSKLRYVLCQRIFLSYGKLKVQFPVLQKHKWLTPLYQVVRWVRLLITGGVGRSVREVRLNVNLDQDSCQSVGQLLDDLEL